ncbi:hypothetical protein LCGC14_1193240 [marine sediment metagenome]|uniref:Uncharacterized protein n=1 Tax=marine sediment metagenome TaxID=412755 RepID=A0A0F9M6J9_9ZZZZ
MAFRIEAWLPMMPAEGPPLPRNLGLYWPWYELTEIQLTAGENDVIYTGESKKAGIAMQSIAGYLESAYYYDGLAGIWKQAVYDTILEPDMQLVITVSKDCVWKF